MALGLNYRDHIAESHSVRSRDSRMKSQASHSFPEDPERTHRPERSDRYPKFLNDYGFENLRTDYEGELAIIIKDRCRNVRPEDALKHVLGFTCMNDVSQRNLQTGDRSGWFRGKSLDTFGPVGPQVVLIEDLGDPQNLRLQTA